VQIKAVAGAMEQIHASIKLIQAAFQTLLVEQLAQATVVTQRLVKLHLLNVHKDSTLMDGNHPTPIA
jgi:hypothetical protein